MKEVILPFWVEAAPIRLDDGTYISHCLVEDAAVETLKTIGAFDDWQTLPAKYKAPDGVTPYHQWQGKDVRQMRPAVINVSPGSEPIEEP